MMDLIINKILENKELALSGIVSFAGGVIPQSDLGSG